MSEKQQVQPKAPRDDREARVADALRENLRKRKTQQSLRDAADAKAKEG